MNTIERQTIITPVKTEDSTAAVVTALLGLVLLSVLCYFLFFKNDHIVTNTTTVLPAAAPTQSAPTPSLPAPNTTVNMTMPAPTAAPAPAATAPAAAPTATTSEQTSMTETKPAATQSTSESSSESGN